MRRNISNIPLRFSVFTRFRSIRSWILSDTSIAISSSGKTRYDHLVSTDEQVWQKVEAKCLRRREVDNSLVMVGIYSSSIGGQIPKLPSMGPSTCAAWFNALSNQPLGRFLGSSFAAITLAVSSPHS